MDAPPKEVFIVHTKRDKRESTLADKLICMLPQLGIGAWQYQDWRWQRKQPPPGPRHSRSGTKIDMGRVARGRPDVFKRPRTDQVDAEKLGGMLGQSRVVLLCEPREGVPSAGVREEAKQLEKLVSPPILLNLRWPDSTSDYFSGLRDVLEVQLSDSVATPEVVEELAAAVGAAWLVHVMHFTYGGAGGDPLLEIAGTRDAWLERLIHSDPARPLSKYEEPQAPDGWNAEMRACYSDTKARERRSDIERFDEWWRTEAAALRQCAGRSLDGGPMAAALRTLVAAVDPLPSLALRQGGYA